ncbi:MAG: BolA/IbaG family iron-sulfur metabolism protein [Gammaproteobacteria bacterium]|nr:BolA/IbaG family iron-sulfur metabolism protein [Gammaproteobacteria bacterium]
MKIQRQIETKLKALTPLKLDVINESHMHNVPAGSESHFKVICVADAFEGKARIQRHRLINQILADELAEHIHALSLKLFTPAEWQTAGETVDASPKCRGGTGL